MLRESREGMRDWLLPLVSEVFEVRFCRCGWAERFVRTEGRFFRPGCIFRCKHYLTLEAFVQVSAGCVSPAVLRLVARFEDCCKNRQRALET